jgi:hypothetical protein
MPNIGMRWRHVIINTKNSWLHGDERGFRSRGHRIHSSGNYKHRPPIEEHAGLRKYHEKRSGEEVHISYGLRPIVGRAILEYFKSINVRVAAIAVGKVHAHVLTELVDDYSKVRGVVGHAKRKSSRAIKQWVQGSVWSAGATYEEVNDRQHLDATHDYLIFDQGTGAWSWSYLDRSAEGKFGRKRPRKRKR